MNISPPPSRDRLLFLDNLRYLMVLVVVAFHVSAGYSGLNEFYIETHAGGFFTTLRHLIASIPTMHLLFFVSGYFALPSLRGRGYGQFLGRKLHRLGLPWLLCVLFLGPLMPYLGYYSQSFNGLESDRYWDFWLNFAKSGFRDWLTPVVFTTNPQFHQMHYWFLSDLLQFFALFALVHAIWKRWGRPIDLRARGAISYPRELLIAGLALGGVKFVDFAVHLPHGVFAFFFNDPLANLFAYGGFFALGVCAHLRGWFADGRAPGLFAFGLLLGLSILLGGIGFGLYKFGAERVPNLLFNALGALFESLMVLWFLTIAVGLTFRYLNRPSRFNAMLAANSYNVYLVHYPLILVFRLLLLTWEGPVGVKFALVLLLALFVSHLLSQYLIRPFPRLSAAALVGLNGILFVFGLPASSYSHLLLERRAELRAVIPDPRPERLQAWQPASLDARSRATPMARIAWQEGTLYLASQPKGLRALLPDGSSVVLDDSLELRTLAPLPGGNLAAIEVPGNRILALNREGRIGATLVDPSDSTGKLLYLTADARGGIYFTVELEGNGKLFYRQPEGSLREELANGELKRPVGLALSADGSTLFASDRASAYLWAFAVAADGSLTGGRPFAELFLANGRYGRAELGDIDPQVEGVTTDQEGRLYAATRFGVQVFGPEGRLLGLVTFPDLPLSWSPKRPLSCAFGGPKMSTLYLSCGDEVFALSTQATGFQVPGVRP